MRENQSGFFPEHSVVTIYSTTNNWIYAAVCRKLLRKRTGIVK